MTKHIASIDLYNDTPGALRPSYRMVLRTEKRAVPVYAADMATIGSSLDIAARLIAHEIYDADTAQDLLPIVVEVEEPVPA